MDQLVIAILQRVKTAEVLIQNQQYNAIEKGLLILLGVSKGDTENDINYLINKIIKLRIFNDQNNKMNLSISDINGDIMVVSQFTLLANIKKGMRPSFINSAEPNLAEKLYDGDGSLSGGWNFGPKDDDILTVMDITKKLCNEWGNHATWEEEGSEN
ncbi:MAG: D-tyrosyl-tRNA(Tyr) deacylase, partial [Candidatus Marinimicrobia bacterium]|nr:D-tyrosyl-tRNA(Tyr) deacylase [Candidatus Neomarinimicrobiota bacterium]